jgi:hypothetical protein
MNWTQLQSGSRAETNAQTLCVAPGTIALLAPDEIGIRSRCRRRLVRRKSFAFAAICDHGSSAAAIRVRGTDRAA